MRHLIFLSMVTLFGCSSFPSLAHSTELSQCPIAELGETAEDCPWAGVARSLQESINSRTDVMGTFMKMAPRFLEHLDSESSQHGNTPGYKTLWGQSINFDEGAKAIIIPNEIIDIILIRAGVAPRDGRIVHAGFEHTYGYLLSNLKTPYGYKRARWVRSDLDQGFKLPLGTLAMFPVEGSFFTNVTYFAGRIAFRHDPAALALVEKGQGVSPSLKKYDYSDLKPTRLEETLFLAGGRTVTLRTDFVPFIGGEFGGNGEALIYSVKDSSLPFSYLVSMFPVASSFRNGALNPAGLGNDKPIITRYNAFVPGVTDSESALSGLREINN